MQERITHRPTLTYAQVKRKTFYGGKKGRNLGENDDTWFMMTVMELIFKIVMIMIAAVVVSRARQQAGPGPRRKQRSTQTCGARKHKTSGEEAESSDVH